RLACIVCALGFLSGCRVLDDAGTGHPLEVHLQSGFRGDLVLVEINGAAIFEGRVETDPWSGLARVVEHNLDEGRHRIRIQVGNVIDAERALTFEPPLAIGVRFNRDIVSSSGGLLGIEYRVADSSSYWMKLRHWGWW